MGENYCLESNISSLSKSHNKTQISFSSIFSNKSTNSKKSIFEVIHKKEIVYISSKNKKHSSKVEYKCIYCNKTYPTLHRIKSHLKFHVRI